MRRLFVIFYSKNNETVLLRMSISQEMNELLSSLPFADGDKVCSLSSELATKHEHIGFVAGLQLGEQLMLELGKEVAR